MILLEVVWLGAVGMTAREQLVLEAMEWCAMGEQGAQELQGVGEYMQGTAEEEGGDSAVIKGEKGPR